MNIVDIKFLNRSKKAVSLNDFEGNVFLIVNTASKCGFTPHFEGLEELHQNYHDKGLQIIGFPCAQFNNQDFNDANESAEYCKLNYGVTFPIMDKIDVNGSKQAELFRELKSQQKGIFGSKKIKWNFTKFLIVDGKVIKRYSSKVKPADIEEDLLNYLK